MIAERLNAFTTEGTKEHGEMHTEVMLCGFSVPFVCSVVKPVESPFEFKSPGLAGTLPEGLNNLVISFLF